MAEAQQPDCLLHPIHRFCPVNEAKPFVCENCSRHFSSREGMAQHVGATHGYAVWAATHEAKIQTRSAVPICLECGQPATMTASRYGATAECRGLRSYNFKPLVDHETRALRGAAHAALDALWTAGTFLRGEGFRWPQLAMRMAAAGCHISQMTAEAANSLVKLSRDGSLLHETVS